MRAVGEGAAVSRDGKSNVAWPTRKPGIFPNTFVEADGENICIAHFPETLSAIDAMTATLARVRDFVGEAPVMSRTGAGNATAYEFEVARLLQNALSEVLTAVRFSISAAGQLLNELESLSGEAP